MLGAEAGGAARADAAPGRGRRKEGPLRGSRERTPDGCKRGKTELRNRPTHARRDHQARLAPPGVDGARVRRPPARLVRRAWCVFQPRIPLVQAQPRVGRASVRRGNQIVPAQARSLCPAPTPRGGSQAEAKPGSQAEARRKPGGSQARKPPAGNPCPLGQEAARAARPRHTKGSAALRPRLSSWYHLRGQRRRLLPPPPLSRSSLSPSQPGAALRSRFRVRPMAHLPAAAASGAQEGRVSVVLGAQWGDEGKGAFSVPPPPPFRPLFYFLSCVPSVSARVQGRC